MNGAVFPDLVNNEQLATSIIVFTYASFMRVLMRGFNQETTLRFATMDLVRSNWRRYPKKLHPIPGSTSPEEGVEADPTLSFLEIGQVTLEENSTNQPPYMLPPGIEREE